MTKEQATSLVKSELEKKETLTAQELSDRTGVSVLMVYKVIKPLIEQELIVLKDSDGVKSYTMSKGKSTSKSESKPIPKKKLGRDTTRFTIDKNKQAYSKGQCAYQVVRMHIEKTKPTLEQLRLDFPDKIVGRFGVINTLKEAQQLSPDRPGYNMKEHHIMKTPDGALVVVTNQWTLERFVEFMAVAKTLGFEIKPE